MGGSNVDVQGRDAVFSAFVDAMMVGFPPSTGALDNGLEFPFSWTMERVLGIAYH